MKMRHELITVRNEFNYLIGKQVRLNRRNTITLNTIYLIQYLYKRKEIFIRIAINSGLPNSLSTCGEGRGEDNSLSTCGEGRGEVIPQIHTRQNNLLHSM